MGQCCPNSYQVHSPRPSLYPCHTRILEKPKLPQGILNIIHDIIILCCCWQKTCFYRLQLKQQAIVNFQISILHTLCALCAHFIQDCIVSSDGWVKGGCWRRDPVQVLWPGRSASSRASPPASHHQEVCAQTGAYSWSVHSS
jgi:hypothetical protein